MTTDKPLPTDREEGAGTRSNSSTGEQSSPQRRILVVDDEEKLSRFVKICLERDGFFVTTSETVGGAQPLIEDEPWDLVITDLIMPMDSGFSLIQWLKESKPHLPVVVMTAHSSDLVYNQAIQQGAVDVLYKPFSLDNLRQTIHKALRSSR
jgi:DNA-binding NtrC family response regulator